MEFTLNVKKLFKEIRRDNYMFHRTSNGTMGGRKMKNIEKKKGIMGPVISVFVLVLIVSILAGLTFLFVGQLKTQVANTAGATSTAYNATNATEAAGYTVVGYLPLIFLAIIFGAILTLVLKIILPYINLGQNMGGF